MLIVVFWFRTFLLELFRCIPKTGLWSILTSFVGHDDDDGGRTVALGVVDAERDQVLRVGLQPGQRVALKQEEASLKPCIEFSSYLMPFDFRALQKSPNVKSPKF